MSDIFSVHLHAHAHSTYKYTLTLKQTHTLTSMYVIYAHLHTHIYTCTFTQTDSAQYSGTQFLLSLVYWGAMALLSAAFGGSVIVGKMLLKNFSSSLDEVANVSVCTDVW